MQIKHDSNHRSQVKSLIPQFIKGICFTANISHKSELTCMYINLGPFPNSHLGICLQAKMYSLSTDWAHKPLFNVDF